MSGIELVLLAGIVFWYLSRIRTRTPNQGNNNGTLKLKIYEWLLIGAELFTIFIVWFQFYVYSGKWQAFAKWQNFGIFLFFLGIFLCILARYTLKENWRTARAFARPQRLVDSGIYAHIRHPIYLGSLLMGLGFELTIGSWLFFVVLIIGTPFVWGCAYKEEQLLKKWLGQDYQDYKKRTSWFIPWIF